MGFAYLVFFVLNGTTPVYIFYMLVCYALFSYMSYILCTPHASIGYNLPMTRREVFLIEREMKSEICNQIMVPVPVCIVNCKIGLKWMDVGKIIVREALSKRYVML